MPLELITMGASGIFSAVMSLWSQSMKAKQKLHEMQIDALKTKAGVIDEARRYSNEGFQFTRRIIALAAVGAIIVWPKVVPVLFPHIAVTVGYTEWDPGFLFFSGSEETTWRALSGLVLTPLDTHLMSSIVGLYFGASVVKNAR